MLLTTIAVACALPAHSSDTTVRIPRGAAVSVETMNSSITVRVGNSDDLSVRGGTARVRGNAVRIEADGPQHQDGGPISITLPASSRLSLSSYNGNIAVTGPVTRLDVESVSGSIQYAGGTGNASLESVSGAVVITDFHGDRLSIEATNGQVSVTGSSGAFDIEAVNGAVRMRDMRASSVDASTVNDVVEYSGTLAKDGSYSFESHNGGVLLFVPGDVSARMTVSTFNGSFSTPEIQGVVTGNPGRATRRSHNGRSEDDIKEFTVVYGNGDAQVSIDSFNGSITVRRFRGRE